MTHGALPTPKRCPVCGAKLHKEMQIVFMLKKTGGGDPWSYTGPGAPVSRWRGYPRNRRKLKRQMFVCHGCAIRVVLHRDRRAARAARMRARARS